MRFLIPRYFSTNSGQESTFRELSEDTFDEAFSDLWDHFERQIQTSKSNSFDPAELERQIWSGARASEGEALRRALDDIGVC